MAINSAFLFKNNARIGALFFDAILKEKHSYHIRLTKNPVEFGANVVDDAIVEPRKIEVDIVVGDVSNIAGFFYFNFNARQRSADALSRLYQMAVNRQPLTVILYLAKYTNMFITGIDATRTKENGSTLIATVTLEELNTVNSSNGSLNLNNDRDAYQPRQNSGIKQGQLS